MFNLGAGVDALLARGVVPAGLPVVRLVDACMAVKIAEYAISTHMVEAGVGSR